MLKTVDQIKNEIQGLSDRVQAIAEVCKAENRDYNEAEKAEVDSIILDGGKIDALNADLDRATKFEEKIKAIAANRFQERIDNRNSVGDQKPVIRIPATARKVSKLVAFANNNEGEEAAFACGKFFQATLGRNRAAAQWCQEHGMDIRAAMSEGDALYGGVFVPTQFESAFINLKEQYGVFGQNIRKVQMTSDTMVVPRRLSGLTVYFPGEGGTITASDVTANDVSLTVKKATTLTKISSELSEDAIISIADLLAQEIAYAHAVKEDNIGFLGDGTSTYGNMTGLDNVLAAGSIATATSTTIGALTLAECEAAVAKLPQFPGISPKWYIHSSLFWNGPARLQMAAGGNMSQNIAGGPSTMMFLGYPVVYTQALSSAGTTGTTWAFFGDLSMVGTMGVRRGLSVAADSSLYFAQDQVAVRSTYRYDIRIHEQGTSSVAGPVVKCKLG